jgi:hypothetical protein
MWRNAIVSGQSNVRIQPELALAIWRPNVNVGWLSPLIGIEVKSK